jgi:hypothetical protein
MQTRADRIHEILTEAGGRLRARDIHTALAAKEDIDPDDLNGAIVPSTARQDNATRRNAGRQVRFNLYNDGDEEWGYISLAEPDVGAVEADPVPELIEKTNNDVRDQLKSAISELSWQQFESSFLEQILEALGFADISITQRTRDGGSDALCSYKRGLVQSETIVSAKHWSSNNVGPDEVQRMRGIKGNADTAVIVTSSSFTTGAVTEAEPSQNQRSIVLVDGDLIVSTCLEHGIGVRKRELPILYAFSGFQTQQEGEETG